MKPRPWQVTGAEFLAARTNALLADSCRVGKTGSALLAANLVDARRVAIVTTKSGVPVWRRAVAQWGLEAPIVEIVAWSSPDMWKIGQSTWDVLIGDECHKAANPGAQRTKDFYGELCADGYYRRDRAAVARAERVWTLSATPAPHDNSNLYPMLRALAVERLGLNFGPTAVHSWPAFRDRYCVMAKKKLPNGQKIDVVVAGKNSAELGDRMRGFFLRRTQDDVGIAEPTYDLLPLPVTERAVRDVEQGLPMRVILEAAAAGDTDKLDIHLGPLMRLTATHKAALVADLVKDELDGGLDKIVLAYRHRDVGDLLANELTDYGVLRIDGETSDAERARIQSAWPNAGCRVFLAQMEAAGEAIDLSAAASMIIVEPVFRPATMQQVALRITNMQEKRTPLVRVAVLDGSIDLKVQERLLSLWTGIREVFG